MRIAVIVAGAGDLYCGACHRDATLCRALASAGQEVLAIPVYTPLRTDRPLSGPVAPVFLGGINLFLDQAMGLFKRLPAGWRRQLDRPGVLRWAARFSLQTSPARLGPMTVGMLRGIDGPHAAAIERLITFLRESYRPDIVHLSNSLLAFLGPPLKKALGVPVVCALQGEESFIDGLPTLYRAQARALWETHARALDGLISCAAERAGVLAQALALPAERFRTIPTGLDAAPFALSPRARAAGPWRVGYLSSIRPEKGLDLLVESLRRLVIDERLDVRLQVAGQVLDPAYWKRLRRMIADLGWGDRVSYRGVLDLPRKALFLGQCDLFVMPTRLPESRAVAAMEALAAGVPVVAAETGVLPELLATTAGGITVTPGDPAALARAIADLLADPTRRAAMSRAGPAAIATHYSPALMATRTIALYDELLSRATVKS